MINKDGNEKEKIMKDKLIKFLEDPKIQNAFEGAYSLLLVSILFVVIFNAFAFIFNLVGFLGLVSFVGLILGIGFYLGYNGV